jgi:hypothetical protein
MSSSGGKFAAQDWDEARMGFQTSIMVNTSLHSLAQNLDGPDWPLPGKDETPTKYIDLTFEELQLTPGLAGYPDRIDQLITILQETLAFDNPFGEMIEQTAATSDRDNPLLKNLAKLDIPADYPIELTTISADAKEFCKLEKIATLGEFAHFAQGMPPNVIVGGDFRTLLNALAHVNEEALATIVPFRPGSKGLHLPEALGQFFEAVPIGERLALFKRFGGRLEPEQEAKCARLSKDDLKKAEAALRERATVVFNLFRTDLDKLAASLKEGGSLERYLAVLADPLKEALAAELLEPVVRKGSAPPEVRVPVKKEGFWGFFSRLFKE